MKKQTALFGVIMALNAQAAPLMNLFELGVAQGKTAKYDQVAEHNIGTSIANEKGTLAMYSVKQQDNPEMAYMVEIYADDAAYQIHRNSPQYQAFAKVSPEILTNHKKRMALVPQFLGDKKVKCRKLSRCLHNRLRKISLQDLKRRIAVQTAVWLHSVIKINKAAQLLLPMFRTLKRLFLMPHISIRVRITRSALPLVCVRATRVNF